MKKQSAKTTAKKTKVKDTVNEVDTTAGEAELTEQSKNQLKVDVDYLKTTNVHFVVHCPTGNISENSFISFIKFGNIAKQLGIEWSVETTVNEQNSFRAKNMLTAKFMTLSEKTHLMFVDPDVSFEPWQVLVLLDRKVDVICGLYPVKTLPIRWAVSTFEGAQELEDGLHEIDRVGMGFMLVKKEVFEKLKSHPQVKQFKNDIGMDEKFDEQLYTYFFTDIVESQMVPEDAVFSAICKSLDFKLWVDKRVMLANKGHFNYSAVAQDVLMNSYGNMYLDILKSNGKVQLLEDSSATE